MVDMLYDRLSSLIGSGKKDDVNCIIAEYVLQNIEKMADMSIYMLAKNCGVSTATVTRFVQKCGYENYIDFKDQCYEEADTRVIAQNSHPLEEMPFRQGFDEINRNKDMDMLFAEVKKSITESSLEQAKKFAEEIHDYENVAFYGISFVQIVAEHIGNELLNLGKYCTYLTRLEDAPVQDREKSMLVIITMFGLQLPLSREFYQKAAEKYSNIWIITQNPRGKIPCKVLKFELCQHSTANYMAWMMMADEIVYLYKEHQAQLSVSENETINK
ncbi:MAG: hypothetical protein K6F39_05805 [Lachnospiraceae bacterium]|nr:hypothetical protein [Lachnospiraceae bacterium]